MTEPLILKPALHEKIWGGTALRDIYDFDIPSENTGEAWVISGHSNGPVTVTNGKHMGKPWQNYGMMSQRYLLTKMHRPFPLLVKILDASRLISTGTSR